VKVSEFIKTASARLKQQGCECADFQEHARDILLAFFNWDSAKLITSWDLEIEDLKGLEGFLLRRLKGEPLQYLRGYVGFWKSSFKVGPGVLIPRAETEILVECAKNFPENAKVAELGLGSGNIAISALQERPDLEWYGWEKNPQSIPYLRENISNLLSSGFLKWSEGDFFESVEAYSPYDALVSNPPYVTSSEISHLSREVQTEPKLALDGGKDGFEILRRLAVLGTKILKKGGGIYLEIDSKQKTEGVSLLESLGYRGVKVHLDLAGQARVLEGIF